MKSDTVRKLVALNPDWERLVFEAAAKIAGGDEELQCELETSLTEAVEQAVMAAE